MRQIPNILTVIRLLLVPVFLLVFFCGNPLWALVIFVTAGATDVLDGYLARRNNWGSTFGKVLDPIADKSMQFAAMIALVAGGYLPWWLALPFFLKELAQGVLAFLMLRRRDFIVVSKWYGKAAVTLFYGAVIATVILAKFAPGSAVGVLVMWTPVLAFLVFVFFSYIVSYARLAARLKAEKKGN